MCQRLLACAGGCCAAANPTSLGLKGPIAMRAPPSCSGDACRSSPLRSAPLRRPSPNGVNGDASRQQTAVTVKTTPDSPSPNGVNGRDPHGRGIERYWGGRRLWVGSSGRIRPGEKRLGSAAGTGDDDGGYREGVVL